ncbi:uncharacterized protein TNCV_2068831 [Trichonephila clavipes]|uniref:Transposase n=1 Tax=Trichonephila clavipes TaxID=2585209 RepID=A0A8X6W2T8_TRICX|nr:uncharacterized protein TNCV_2068831 [Trichonephila clavipes]
MSSVRRDSICYYCATSISHLVQLFDKVYGPLVFGESTVTISAYLDALQLWLFPQLEEGEPANFIWQQDSALPHWHLSVCDWLNFAVPEQWIGRKGPDDKACFAWSPRSPDLKPNGDRFNSCQVIYSQFGLAIHQNDHQARRRFVEWAQNEIAVVPDFHKRILFSDEAHFWLNGYVNKQNCRIWSEANPQVYVETPLHPEKLTVWCTLWAGGILLQKR